MKSLKTTLMIAAVAVAAVGCNSEQPSKTLVLYYSQNGTTKVVAEQIAALTGADIEAFDVVNPYNGNYGETIARAGQERAEGTIAELEPLQVDLTAYDTIFLGYPIWYGSYALPVASLLETCNLDDKKIIPFCTFGSGGLESSTADLVKNLPNSEIAAGYGVRTARINAAAEEVERFLIENGYVAGEIEALPEFSEQQEVTDAEVAIFNAACGDYQFPLGTPKTVGQRTYGDTTEYEYHVEMASMTGETINGTIYVICKAHAKPEFTRVVR